jgi:hypothetical protein
MAQTQEGVNMVPGAETWDARPKKGNSTSNPPRPDSSHGRRRDGTQDTQTTSRPRENPHRVAMAPNSIGSTYRHQERLEIAKWAAGPSLAGGGRHGGSTVEVIHSAPEAHALRGSPNQLDIQHLQNQHQGRREQTRRRLQGVRRCGAIAVRSEELDLGFPPVLEEGHI